MLPILPILLLLFMQAPADLERVALRGQLPAAIQAIQRLEKAPSERDVFASLLEVSNDPDLRQALLAILHWAEGEPQPEHVPILEEPRVSEWPSADPPLSRGFAKGQRPRDGPVQVV